MLCFTAVGDEGRRVQQLTDDQIKSEIHSKLKRAYPEQTVPEPLDVYLPRWDSDPLFRGCYSFEGCKPEKSDENLRAPIKQEGHGAIYFAGEGMHRIYKGYMQAAYLSGQEEADNIATYLSTRCTTAEESRPTSSSS